MTRQPKEPKLESSRAARSDYLKYAQRVIGDDTIDCPTLYARFVENDWAADKLDEAVALEALRAGETPRWVLSRVWQSPYMQSWWCRKLLKDLVYKESHENGDFYNLLIFRC